jgi:integrase
VKPKILVVFQIAACTTFAQEAEKWIEHAELRSLQKELKSSGSKNLTVNRKTEVLTTILNFSVKNRTIPFNPAAGFQKLPSDQMEMSFWERHEAESFLQFANAKYPEASDARWVYVVYLLALNTGIRAGEIWGLQTRDIVGGETLFIRRQYDRVKLDFGPPKGKKSRHVPCQPELRKELLSLIHAKSTKPDQTIFHGESGRPLSHDSFGDRRFARDVMLWKGRRIRFHDMRHTAATLMIGSGIDLRTVQEICGHKDIKTTMGYAHLLGDNLRRVAQTFSVKPGVISEADFEGPRLQLLSV